MQFSRVTSNKPRCTWKMARSGWAVTFCTANSRNKRRNLVNHVHCHQQQKSDYSINIVIDNTLVFKADGSRTPIHDRKDSDKFLTILLYQHVPTVMLPRQPGIQQGQDFADISRSGYVVIAMKLVPDCKSAHQCTTRGTPTIPPLHIGSMQ